MAKKKTAAQQTEPATTKAPKKTNGGSIHTKAMLSSLHLRYWAGRKYDKKISAETSAKYGASNDAGKYTKRLLPGDSESYKKLTALIVQIRLEHYRHTLAWSDEGWRLLPTENYMAYTEFTRKAQADLEAAKAAFLADYPTLREQAKTLLNGMYNDEDYPEPYELERRFAIEIDFSPLPAEGDFRCALPAEELARIEAETAGRIREAVGTAMEDAWSRLYEVVEHIHERLAQPEAIFRDSLIQNAKELCDVLPRLNVTSDRNLAEMVENVRKNLANQEPEALRTEPKAREAVAKQAADIMDRMRGFYQPPAQPAKKAK